jgi:2-methylcitrate dehydratase PrpD
MRSRITIGLKDGRTVAGWADERYRGGPDNPLSDAELEAKVRSCCDGVLDCASQSKLIDAAVSVTNLADAGDLMKILNRVV